jgi:segregation and condensation protein B
MSKVKGRRKPLHSEITSLRRSKKAAVVEAPAPDAAETESASVDEASPESEVSAEAPAENLAEAAPGEATELVEATEPVDRASDAAADGANEPAQEPEILAPAEEDFDGLSLESLASVDEEPELPVIRDPERDGAPSDPFEPDDDRPAPSNVVSIDGDEPDDMEAFLCGLIEALLFTSQKPLPLKDLARSAGIDRPRARELVERLMRNYAPRGINIEEVAGGYVLRSSARYAPQIQKFLSLRPVRLSRAQLETLAIVAYRQPVTKPEVDDIRGVDSGQVLKGLLERDLLKTLGKKDEPGRPMLYGTTNDFLELLNLRSLGELPTLREYTELSDESKRKFAEETGEEAPNELPLTETAAVASQDIISAEGVPPVEGIASEGSPATDPSGDLDGSDPAGASASSEAEQGAADAEAKEPLDSESGELEPPRARDDVEAARPAEDEEEPVDEDAAEKDEDDLDEDEDDDDDLDEDEDDLDEGEDDLDEGEDDLDEDEDDEDDLDEDEDDLDEGEDDLDESEDDDEDDDDEDDE